MGRSQETFNKKEVAKRKDKKRKEKMERKLAKKDSQKKNSLDDMIAYVDENGMLTSTPPDPNKKRKTKLKDIEISVPKSEAIDPDEPLTGTISYFNESKGFGFVKDNNSHDSAFFHQNNVEGAPKQGNKVSFKIEKGPKGLTAVEVKIIG